MTVVAPSAAPGRDQSAPSTSSSSSAVRLLRSRPAVLGALVLVTRLPGLVAARTFNTDEATLATGGQVLLRGGSLYVDFLDRKPPLPFAAYAAAFGATGTTDLRWVRLVVATLVLVAALVAADEAGRRWGTRAGWVAGVVLVLGASALGPTDAQAANFELFALAPMVVAVVAAARGRVGLAGVALAVAVLCKQPAAITVVPVAWSWWRTGRWRGVATGLAAGAAAGLVLAAGFGVGLVLEWALLGTGGYLAMTASDVGFALGRLAAITGLAVGFWGGAWLLVEAARRAPFGRPDTASDTASAGEATPDGATGPTPGDATDLWLLLWVSAVGLVPGFRFFPHYLVQLLPAVALLAARGAVQRPGRVRAALVWGVGATVVAAGLAWQVGLTPAPRVERHLAAYARATTRPDDGILVWGNVPEVYWRADRAPAGGFPHTEFVTGYSGGRRHTAVDESTVVDDDVYRDWIARLRAEPPELILDTSAAGLRGGEYFPLADFDALTRLVRERYRRVATIDGVPVFRLDAPSGRATR